MLLHKFEDENDMKKHAKTHEYYDFIAVFVQCYHISGKIYLKFRLE